MAEGPFHSMEEGRKKLRWSVRTDSVRENLFVGPDVCDIDAKRRILHSSTTEKDASGFRTIRLESTYIDTFDSVGIETNCERPVYMNWYDVVGTIPSSVKFVWRVDLEQYLFIVSIVVVEPM